FINKLPHHLIAAFHATLSEIEEADLLINILDVSHLKLEEENRATYSVLKQLKAENIPVINVLNKIDLVNNGYLLSRYRRAFDSTIAISALQGQGLNQLLDEIAQILEKKRVYSEFSFPYQRSDLISLVYSKGEVLSRNYLKGKVVLRVRLNRSLANKLAEFKQREKN
ncbi:MAG: GTPase HflX, partial [bacterium]